MTAEELRARARDKRQEAEEQRHLAQSLDREAAEIERQAEAAQRSEAAKVPVDRSARQLTDGSPIPDDDSHTELRADGQQKGYVVLSPEERAKGFVRPYRDAYRHVGRRPRFPLRDLTDEEQAAHAKYGYVKFEEYPESERPKVGEFWTEAKLNSGCGKITTMGRSIAETYARDPAFYSGTFCATCRAHFPVGAQGEFTWYEMDGREGPRVGT